MFAASRNSESCVRLLLQAGAHVNEPRDHKGLNPLSVAAYAGSFKALQLLLEAGADVNASERGGSAPIYQAARSGCEDCITALIKAGANVNTTDETGRSPLMKATERSPNLKYSTAVRCLIEVGADVNITDQYDNTALIIAARAVDKTSKNSPDDELARVTCIRALLQGGAHVNKRNQTGFNALQLHLADCYKICEDTTMVLYAAGEKLEGLRALSSLPSVLKHKMELKYICRETIRNHLTELNPHEHLFNRIPQLPLPSILTEFLLYNVTLEITEDDDDNNDDIDI